MAAYDDTFDKKVDGYGLTLGAADGGEYQISCSNLGMYSDMTIEEFTFDINVRGVDSDVASMYANFTREALTELRDYIDSRLNPKE